MLALAGCGGSGGYGDAPTIALPSETGMTAAEPAQEPPPEAARPAARAGYSGRPTNLLPPPPQQGLPPDAPQDTGPRGTSGEVREDAVGYAALITAPPDERFAGVAVGVGHRSMPPGGFVELTALDTGRTIVAMVVTPDDEGAVVALSPGAAQALGVGDRAAVRVRSTTASPQDQVALRSGHTAAPRLDAPEALLTALRHKLPAQQRRPARVPASVRTTAPRIVQRPAAPPVHAAAPRGGYYVQVAALSSVERAAALARQLGGHVAASGSLYRVQIGPFPDPAGAQRARDDVARKGYRDARILHTD